MTALRVYCASPYTSSTPEKVEANVAHAVAIGQQVRTLGVVPVVPHISLPPYRGLTPRQCWDFAMRECLSHLATCDAILLTGTWDHSDGCAMELAHAYEWKIPAFYTLAELQAWAEDAS